MVEKYLGAVIQKYKTGKTTEHSFRGDLQDFVERTVIGVQAINEPRRQKCGAPDYIIQKKNIPIGYIEAKDIDKSLDTIDKTEQLDRYKASLDNLILTNYLEYVGQAVPDKNFAMKRTHFLISSFLNGRKG